MPLNAASVRMMSPSCGALARWPMTLVCMATQAQSARRGAEAYAQACMGRLLVACRAKVCWRHTALGGDNARTQLVDLLMPQGGRHVGAGVAGDDDRARRELRRREGR